MGLIASIEARLDELKLTLLPEARRRRDEWGPAADAEREAGIPATPGSNQARYDAAAKHVRQLGKEFHALTMRVVALMEWRLLDLPPAPERTPPWEVVEAALSAAQPGTPEGGGGQARGWPSSSSSEEAAEPAGDAHASEAAQLLPGRPALSAPALSAPGLRQRQGPEQTR